MVFSNSNSVCLCCFQDNGRSLSGSLSRDFTLSRVVFSWHADRRLYNPLRSRSARRAERKTHSSQALPAVSWGRRSLPITLDCVCINWCTHDFSNSCSGWQLVYWWCFLLGCPVAQTGRISAVVYPLRLCSTVRRSHEEGRVLTHQLCFEFCTLCHQRSTAPRRAAVPSGPPPLHRKHSSPARLEAKRNVRRLWAPDGELLQNYLLGS